MKKKTSSDDRELMRRELRQILDDEQGKPGDKINAARLLRRIQLDEIEEQQPEPESREPHDELMEAFLAGIKEADS